MKVIGIQRNVSYTMDGKLIEGLNLFVAEKRDNVEGLATEKIFISVNKDVFLVAHSLNVNDTFTPIYNRFGKVDGIVLDKK